MKNYFDAIDERDFYRLTEDDFEPPDVDEDDEDLDEEDDEEDDDEF